MLILLRRKTPRGIHHYRDTSVLEKQGRFLTAEWRHLAMLNYEIDPAILQDYVPPGTTLDTWQGKYFISVVGLMFYDTRVFGIPFPFYKDFEELNLRFYVRREVEGEVRRGVVFIKEIVPKRAIASVARATYNENYVYLPMRHKFEYNSSASRDAHQVSYEWLLDSEWNSASVKASGSPALLSEGTEEEFIAEHYWGCTLQRDGSTMEYEVEHPQWRIWRADDAELACDVEKLYGKEFTDVLSPKPASAFLAEGSEVLVRRGVVIG